MSMDNYARVGLRMGELEAELADRDATIDGLEDEVRVLEARIDELCQLATDTADDLATLTEVPLCDLEDAVDRIVANLVEVRG